MSRASVLAMGRSAAVAGMIDTCTIRRRTGQTTAADGTVTPTYTVIYNGICRVQEGSGGADLTGASSRVENPGEARFLMVRRALQLPVPASLGVRAEDIATINTCVNDPDLIGRMLVVRGEAAGSEKTARRLGTEEVTS